MPNEIHLNNGFSSSLAFITPFTKFFNDRGYLSAAGLFPAPQGRLFIETTKAQDTAPQEGPVAY